MSPSSHEPSGQFNGRFGGRKSEPRGRQWGGNESVMAGGARRGMGGSEQFGGQRGDLAALAGRQGDVSEAVLATKGTD